VYLDVTWVYLVPASITHCTPVWTCWVYHGTLVVKRRHVGHVTLKHPTVTALLSLGFITRLRSNKRPAHTCTSLWRSYAPYYTMLHIEYDEKLIYCEQIVHQPRTQYVEGIYNNSLTLKRRLKVTQDHWKWHHLIDRIRLPIRLP